MKANEYKMEKHGHIFIYYYFHATMILLSRYKRKLIFGFVIGSCFVYLNIAISHLNMTNKKEKPHIRELPEFVKMHQKCSNSALLVKTSDENVKVYNTYTFVDMEENYDTDKLVHKHGGDRKVILRYNPRHKDITRFYDYCAYNNCMVTSDEKYLVTADALIYEVCRPNMGIIPPIDVYHRNPDQVWIIQCFETPLNYPFDDYKSKAWQNVMNWSITHRLDSDIIQSWGMLKSRIEPQLPLNYESIYNAKTKLALWAVSHCLTQSAREHYVSDMIHYGIDVDIVGRCGPTKEHINIDKNRHKYKFYLAFENSLCRDYITEKFFRNYQHDWILVVRGGADYHRLLPTDTYINTDDFANVSQLAHHLISLGKDKDRYIDFLRKKDRYESIQIHGAKHSHCELCKRLNNLPLFRKTYPDIRDYVESAHCRQPTDVKHVYNVSQFRNYERAFNNLTV